jgi:hypothetical protein
MEVSQMRNTPSYSAFFEARRKRRQRNIITACVVAAVAILLVGAFASQYYQKDPVTITVTGKESVNTHDGHEYRVYTDDGTYVIGDSLVYTRFRSSEDYGKLQVGKTYNCTAYGMRIPLFSTFRNLMDCHGTDR